MPMCKVTVPKWTPSSRSFSNSSGVKCNPAVLEATDPLDAAVDGLVALGVS